MSKKVCCPKCQSENIRSFDNQPLYFAEDNDVRPSPNSLSYDTEIYIQFICNNCSLGVGNESFTLVFDIVPR